MPKFSCLKHDRNLFPKYQYECSNVIYGFQSQTYLNSTFTHNHQLCVKNENEKKS